MSDLKLYMRYAQINFLAGLQYRGWPMQVFMVLFIVVTDPLEVLLLFQRFGSIGSWSRDRVILVYALALTSFGLAELFARGMDVFPWQVRSGSFDRILLRPRGAFVQVLGLRFQINRLARVVGGLGMVGWALPRQGVNLGLVQYIQLLCALAGGYLVYTGVFVISSATCFWTIQALDWVYIFTNGSYQVTKCPPDLLPPWLRNTFTFFMPMLVISYYPAAAICRWGINPLLGWLALPAGLVFFLASTVLWDRGVEHYGSTGS